MLHPILLVVIAGALQALFNGALSGNLHSRESIILSFASFVFAAALFNGMRLVGRTHAEKSGPDPSWHMVVGINVATATTFLSFYGAVVFIPSASVATLEAAVGPTVILFLERTLQNRDRRKPALAALLLLVSVLFAVRSGVNTGGGIKGWLSGALLALMAGFGAAVIVKLSSDFGKQGISPRRVTAFRYHAAYLASGLLLISSASPDNSISPGRAVFLTIAGVGAIVVPLYLIQVGAQRADPMSVTVCLTLVPPATFLVQVARGQPANVATWGLSLLSVVLSLTYAATTNRRSAVDPEPG